jgi:hypothetical protein
MAAEERGPRAGAPRAGGRAAAAAAAARQARARGDGLAADARFCRCAGCGARRGARSAPRRRWRALGTRPCLVPPPTGAGGDPGGAGARPEGKFAEFGVGVREGRVDRWECPGIARGAGKGVGRAGGASGFGARAALRGSPESPPQTPQARAFVGRARGAPNNASSTPNAGPGQIGLAPPGIAAPPWSRLPAERGALRARPSEATKRRGPAAGAPAVTRAAAHRRFPHAAQRDPSPSGGGGSARGRARQQQWRRRKVRGGAAAARARGGAGRRAPAARRCRT